jgi:hypothetical protein
MVDAAADVRLLGYLEDRMSLCDELYGAARNQLDLEGTAYVSRDQAALVLDRRVLRLLCEQVEKLIADLDKLRRLGV